MNQETKTIDHSQRAHALLSASGASRWLNCTPSARLEELQGPRESSAYAEEGTLAHELSELFVRKDVLHNISDAEFESQLGHIMGNELFDEEMIGYADDYATYCAAQFAEAKERTRLSQLQVEQRIDLREYVPESFGTVDCCILSDGTLEVIDFKYGKGVPVYAEWNPQLMLYGLGALRKYDTLFDINTVLLTIIQPRIDNINSFEISVEDLLKWAEEELKPKAQKAFAGEGELEPGGWCRFCAVRNRCRALYEQQIEIAKHDFKKPELLTDEEIADIVLRSSSFVEWVNSINDYAREQAVSNNKTWPGLKLVEGVSRRKWADPDTVAEAIFAQCPDVAEEELFDMKLKSITQVEKSLGKKRFQEVCADLIVKPQGKPTLVSADDKRPALGIEDAINDFK